MPSGADPLSAALDSIAIGAALVAADGRVLRANPAYLHLFGLAPDELASLEPGGLLHPSDRQADRAQREQAATGGLDRFEADRR